jgi:stage II sporulation protein D
MRRGCFLLLAAAPFVVSRAARAQSDADPESTASAPALRVLLGAGTAAPGVAGTFTFNDRLYRGTFSRLADGEIVNLVDIEAYLASVVPSEMSPSWPAAALQAQAICARTYVLQRSDPLREYDLVPSELDQVYRGVEGESLTSTAAVRATVGQVLQYNGLFARVAYSSCCGGHTEAAADLWGGAPIAYLSGVLCTSCAASPNFRWSATLPLTAIAARFAAPLAILGSLEDVRIAERDASGRVRAFDLVAGGASVRVAGSAFRRAVGTRTLRSLLVMSAQRSPDGTTVDLDGAGLGHGVGLCQWGARGMAAEGRDAAAILAAYFPGTVAGNLER